MNKTPSQRKAFEEQFREYFRPLTVFAMRFLKDQQAAEDVVQDVFLYLYEKPGTGIYERSYLYNLVKNRCLNVLEYKKVRTLHNPGIQSEWTGGSPDPFEVVTRIELEHKYLQVLEGVHPRSRQVFELSRNGGLKNKEIAEKLQISKRTVESHISLVLKELKKYLVKFLPVLLIPLFLMERLI